MKTSIISCNLIFHLESFLNIFSCYFLRLELIWSYPTHRKSSWMQSVHQRVEITKSLDKDDWFSEKSKKITENNVVLSGQQGCPRIFLFWPNCLRWCFNSAFHNKCDETTGKTIQVTDQWPQVPVESTKTSEQQKGKNDIIPSCFDNQ